MKHNACIADFCIFDAVVELVSAGYYHPDFFTKTNHPMSGPAASLLLRSVPSAQTLATIQQAILSISDTLEEDHFGVVSTKAIDGTIQTSNARPFWGLRQKLDAQHPDYSAAELSDIQKAVGFVPQFDFSFFAVYNRPIVLRILGELCVYLAQSLNGIIDFGGAIFPYQDLPDRMKQGLWLWEVASWSDIRPYFKAMIAPMEGCVYTIEYETANHNTWAHHLCDAEFMQQWLQHQEFCMVK